VVSCFQAEVGKLSSLCWRADSSGLVVGGEKLIAVCERAELFSTAQRQPRRSCEPLSLAGHANPITGLAYSPHGRALASWGGRELRTWDLSGGAGQARPRLALSPVEYGGVDNVSWSSDGGRLALTTSFDGRIVTTSDGTLVRMVGTPRSYPSVAF